MIYKNKTEKNYNKYSNKKKKHHKKKKSHKKKCNKVSYKNKLIGGMSYLSYETTKKQLLAMKSLFGAVSIMINRKAGEAKDKAGDLATRSLEQMKAMKNGVTERVVNSIIEIRNKVEEAAANSIGRVLTQVNLKEQASQAAQSAITETEKSINSYIKGGLIFCTVIILAYFGFKNRKKIIEFLYYITGRKDTDLKRHFSLGSKDDTLSEKNIIDLVTEYFTKFYDNYDPTKEERIEILKRLIKIANHKENIQKIKKITDTLA